MPQSNLLEVFLLKIELERLSRERGGNISGSEKALQVENKILKQRLHTLGENLMLLNSRLEEVRSGWGVSSMQVSQLVTVD